MNTTPRFLIQHILAALVLLMGISLGCASVAGEPPAGGRAGQPAAGDQDAAKLFLDCDTVYLRDGTAVNGTLIMAGKAAVVIFTESGEKTFKREQVERILYAKDKQELVTVKIKRTAEGHSLDPTGVEIKHPAPVQSTEAGESVVVAEKGKDNAAPKGAEKPKAPAENKSNGGLLKDSADIVKVFPPRLTKAVRTEVATLPGKDEIGARAGYTGINGWEKYEFGVRATKLAQAEIDKALASGKKAGFHDLPACERYHPKYLMPPIVKQRTDSFVLTFADRGWLFTVDVNSAGATTEQEMRTVATPMAEVILTLLNDVSKGNNGPAA